MNPFYVNEYRIIAHLQLHEWNVMVSRARTLCTIVVYLCIRTFESSFKCVGILVLVGQCHIISLGEKIMGITRKNMVQQYEGN